MRERKYVKTHIYTHTTSVTHIITPYHKFYMDVKYESECEFGYGV